MPMNVSECLLCTVRDWAPVHIMGCLDTLRGFPGGSVAKNPPTNAGDAGDSGSIPGLRWSFRGGNGTHSSVLLWEVPWTEEPGRYSARGCRVRHGWATGHLRAGTASFTSTFQVSLPGLHVTQLQGTHSTPSCTWRVPTPMCRDQASQLHEAIGLFLWSFHNLILLLLDCKLSENRYDFTTVFVAIFSLLHLVASVSSQALVAHTVKNLPAMQET